MPAVTPLSPRQHYNGSVERATTPSGPVNMEGRAPTGGYKEQLTMDVALHAPADDAAALAARCRRLGVRHVCLSLGAVPGFMETGVPDRAYLRRFLRRLADAGVEVPVAIAWFGNDPDLVLRPAAHRAAVAAKLRTLEVLSDVGIGALLHYVDVARSRPPRRTMNATGTAYSPSSRSWSAKPRPATCAWPTTRSGAASPTRCAALHCAMG